MFQQVTPLICLPLNFRTSNSLTWSPASGLPDGLASGHHASFKCSPKRLHWLSFLSFSTLHLQASTYPKLWFPFALGYHSVAIISVTFICHLMSWQIDCYNSRDNPHPQHSLKKRLKINTNFLFWVKQKAMTTNSSSSLSEGWKTAAPEELDAKFVRFMHCKLEQRTKPDVIYKIIPSTCPF